MSVSACVFKHRNKAIYPSVGAPKDECGTQRGVRGKKRKEDGEKKRGRKEFRKGRRESKGGKLSPERPRRPLAAGRPGTARSASTVPSSCSPHGRGGAPLTRSEQHGPVEPGGLVRPPCPLIQPLSHALIAADCGAHRGSLVPDKRLRHSDATQPPKARHGSGYLGGCLRGGRRAAAGEGRGAGARP